ncbi:MAG: DUF167 domain-containing protein [Chloroflexi bacterium]|nr:DUF167 domain-containing protein [Chloroflexota bacterium]
MNINRSKKLSNHQISASIRVKISVGKQETKISGILSDGTLKINVAAIPVHGKANTVLIEFLSRVLEVPSNNIEIVSGQANSRKIIIIRSMTSEEMNFRLMKQLQKS